MKNSFGYSRYIPPRHFAMPGEWEKQQALLFSFPSNPQTWPDCRKELEKDYAVFAAAASRFQEVWLLVEEKEEMHAGDLLSSQDANMDNIKFFPIAHNDAWTRDHGPVTVRHKENGSIVFLNFRYNAWGGKFSPWDLDDAVVGKLSGHVGIPSLSVPFICEGGALECNGKGTLLTTESVILNPNRNSGMTRSKAEFLFRKYLGVEKVLFLKSGLEGDDTDGHIDTLARFFSENGVLAPLPGKNSPEYEVLARNFRDLEKMETALGNALNVLPLPHPDTFHAPDSWRQEILPATYANFVIVNGGVLVPTYGQRKDEEAMEVISSVFPGREVVGVDCSRIILEGGALHCLTQNIYS